MRQPHRAPLQVYLRGFDPAQAVLVADATGAVVPLPSGRYELIGDWRLSIAGQLSRPLTPGSGNVVEMDGGDYVASGISLDFSFRPTLVIRPNGPGTSPVFATPGLSVLAGPLHKNARIASGDISLSWVGSVTPTKRGRIYLPQWDGGYRIDDFELADADDPYGGKILEVNNGQLTVVSGGPIKIVAPSELWLSHPWGALIALTDTVQIRTDLQCPPDGPAASTVTPVQPGDLFVRLDRNIGVSLRSDSLYNQRNVTRLSAAEDWVRADGFSDDHLEVGIYRSSPFLRPRTSPVMLRAPQERFALHVPASDPAVAAADAPVLIYQDDDIDAVPTTTSRYEGLRVRQLPGPGGLGAWFDASVVMVAFTLSARGAPKATLVAGKSALTSWPATAGPRPDSRLVPKDLRISQDSPRLLHVPVETMRLAWSPSSQAPTLTLTLDRGVGALSLTDVVLESPPLGMAAQDKVIAAAPDDAYEWMQLRLPAGTSFQFSVGESGVFPAAGLSWLDPFAAVALTTPVLEHPGLTVDVTGGRTRGSAPDTHFSVTYKPDGRTELLSYAALGAGATYAALAAFGGLTWLNRFIDDVKNPGVKLTFEHLVIDPNLPAAERQRLATRNAELIVDNKAPDDLLLRVTNKLTDDDFADFTKGLLGKDPDGTGGGWTFSTGLAVQLYDGPDDGAGGVKAVRYAPQIVRDRFGDVGSSGVIIDFSSVHGLDLVRDLGWATTFADLAALNPELWPTANARGQGAEASRADPSVERWRGFFFRNMPLILDIPPAARVRLGEVGRNVLDTINQHLLLEYGWRDESGATWKAQWAFKTPVAVVPAPLDRVIKIYLLDFSSTGVKLEPLTAGGGIRIVLPFLLDKQNKPFTIDRADFQASFQTGLNYIDVEVSASSFLTDAIPGFTELQVKRFATDFNLAKIDVELTPHPDLAAAVPVLTAGRPLSATLTVPLNDKNTTAKLAFVLPADRQIHLFGKWGFTIQGMEFEFDAGTGAAVTRIHGRLNLGLSGALTVGGWIELRSDGAGGWTLGLLLDRISADIDLGGFRLEGMLAWVENTGDWSRTWLDEANGKLPIPSSQIASAGQKREFLGFLAVRGAEDLLSVSGAGGDPGPADSNYLAVRVSAPGQAPFWICALAVDSFRLGPVGFGDVVLLVARNADIQKELAQGIADLSRQSISKLRPSGDLFDWLRQWSISPDVGTALAMSGRVKMLQQVAEGPAGNDGLSGLVVTEAGLARLDTVISVGDPSAGAKVTLAAALDLKNQYFRASVLLPDFSYPSPNAKQFDVSPGSLVFGFSWGSHTSFELGVGYPPNVGGDPLNADWTHSVKVFMQDLWPINTVWGGFRLAVTDGSSGQIRLGFAARAGWTANYSVTNTNLLDARASVEIALGSITDLVFPTGSLANPDMAPAQLIVRSALSPDLDEIQSLLNELRGPLFFLDARWIFTADGSARGVILGIEILSIGVHVRVAMQVCGPSADGSRIIARAAGYAGFSLDIKIGCDTIHIGGEVFIEMIHGDCVAFDARRLNANFTPVLEAC